jgi:hypothetical protein
MVLTMSGPDIEYTITGTKQASRQQLIAVPGKSRDQQMLESHELVEQNCIPGFYDDVIVVHGSAPGALAKRSKGAGGVRHSNSGDNRE